MSSSRLVNRLAARRAASISSLARIVASVAGASCLLAATACVVEEGDLTLSRRERSTGDEATTDSPAGTPSQGGGSRGSDPAQTPGQGGDVVLPQADGGTSLPPTVDSTKGTGGVTGLNELKSAGGLSYQIQGPQTNDHPRGLLVLLHGSGASNYKNFVGMMANVATANDLIRVSVLAPNGQGWNEGNQTQAAELLHQLLQQDLFPKYDIDKSKVLFSGQSSGGGFLSSYFIPLHAKDYKGGAFLQCGAAPPRPAFTPDDATKRAFRMHFEITTGDTIWPDSYAQAVSVYTQAGMSLTKDNTKPGGHCAFDQQQVIVDHLAQVLAKP